MRHLILSSALFVTAVATHANAAVRPGLYSNVCVERETGDYGGDELGFRIRGGQPWVRLKICEGGCWTEEMSSATLTGDSLAITTTEETTAIDQNGERRQIETHHWTARFQDLTVVLKSLDSKNLPAERMRHVRDYPPTDPRSRETENDQGMVNWPAPIRRC